MLGALATPDAPIAPPSATGSGSKTRLFAGCCCPGTAPAVAGCAAAPPAFAAPAAAAAARLMRCPLRWQKAVESFWRRHSSHLARCESHVRWHAANVSPSPACISPVATGGRACSAWAGGKGSGPKGALSARGPVPVPKLPIEQPSKASGGGGGALLTRRIRGTDKSLPEEEEEEEEEIFNHYKNDLAGGASGRIALRDDEL